MANVNRPRGFTPIGTLSGGKWQDSVELFYLDGTANATAISVGDIVVMTAGGYLNRIATGAGGTDIIGLVVGVPPAPPAFNTTVGTFGGDFLSNSSPTLSGTATRSVAASTAGHVYVTTAPDLVMVGQEDGAATPLTLAAVGAAVDIATAGVNATTGNSTMQIDSSSVGTTANDPLKLMRLFNSPANELAAVDATKPWTDWVVTFNTHWTKDNGGV